MKKNSLILLDYGGVLGFDHLIDAEKKLSQVMGVSVNEMNSRLSEKSENGRAFRENRLSEYEFWNAVGGCALQQYQPSQLTELWMNTYALNMEFYYFCAYLRDICWVGVLTNIDIARSALLKKILNVDSAFDFYFPSYEFGYSKDTPELWLKVNEIITNQLNDVKVIYIDDRQEHVLSAQQIGWQGIQYKEFGEFKSKILSLLRSEVI